MSALANRQGLPLKVAEVNSDIRVIKILSIAILLPQSLTQQISFQEVGMELKGIATTTENIGIVGTIVCLKNCAMIWFGWGQITEAIFAENLSKKEFAARARMGPCVVSMPRTKYKGAFTHATGESSSSKLVGSEFEDEVSLARQMSSRLSQKLGLSIIVSCSLVKAQSKTDMINYRAASLAEREITSLLKRNYLQLSE